MGYEHLKAKVKKKNGLICYYCGDKCVNDCHIDHVIPISKGGYKGDINNMVVSCSMCNMKKGCHLPLEFVKRTKRRLEQIRNEARYLRRIIKNTKGKIW